MSYDCMIIGGGLAGLTCGMKCLSSGLRTVLISGGMNALHFSSGSIDLIGYDGDNNVIQKPFDYLEAFILENKRHPYATVGIEIIREAFDFFKKQVEKENLPLYVNDLENHFHATALGTVKPTYLSQKSVFNEKMRKAFESKAKIAVLEFDGYRDYYASLGLEQLKKNPLFEDTEIITGKITMPKFIKTEWNFHEFRSIDLARIFETEKYLPRLAEEIKKKACNAEVVQLPAFIGITDASHIHTRLEEMTGLLIYEVPTLPPSILGMRLDNAIRAHFTSLGGEYSAGDKVIKGIIENGKVRHILTENHGETEHKAKYYVLSTGSFFSGGLKCTHDHMEEPIFNLAFDTKQPRHLWYSKNFFDKQSHRFLEYGVKTEGSLFPYDAKGRLVNNLLCTGAILSGYNPIKEASGGGVAIATGYDAALRIVEASKGERRR